MKIKIKTDKFWRYYFIVRILYLFFAIFVYAKLTTLGDTERYLTSSMPPISPMMFLNSTTMMDTIGSILGILGGSNVLTNLPATIISYYTIKWAIDKYEFRKYINNYLLFVILCLPNFCVWTGVFSKEMVGLVFSAILGSLFLDFLDGKYKIKKKHWLAMYLCLIFKPQYFPFIMQGLVMVYLMNRYIKSAKWKMFLGCLVIFCNLAVLYLISDIVNQYADIMYVHFDDPNAKSTRPNPWTEENDFFYQAPLGMFIAFFGPTISEMMGSPTHMMAGIESIIILVLFVSLGFRMIIRCMNSHKINVTIFFSYFVVITGIALLHYPFGIFNPGSAIRYRTNFFFLFVLMFLYVKKYYKLFYLTQNNIPARI